MIRKKYAILGLVSLIVIMGACSSPVSEKGVEPSKDPAVTVELTATPMPEPKVTATPVQ